MNMNMNMNMTRTCDPHRIPKENCLVYSFGSNEQFDYEEAILQHLGCEIHTCT